MANVNMQAVRAFNRIMQPLQESLDEAARLDAGFDAGEFSGAWHAQHEEQELLEVAERVGARFSIAGDELLDMLFIAGNREFSKFMECR